MDCVKLNSSEFLANWNQMLYQGLGYLQHVIIICHNPAGRRFFLVTSSIMFFIGTCDVIVSVFLVRIAIKANKAQAQGSPDLPHLLQLYNTFFIVDAILMVVNNTVSSKSYRCYFVWGLRKWVLIGPGLGMLATAVVGSFTATGRESLLKIVFLTPYITVVATSVLLMCLAVSQSRRLESGSLYCLAIIWVVAQSIIYDFPNSGPESVYIFFGVASGVWSQIVNIAPTLILIRTGLGHCKWIQNTKDSLKGALSSTKLNGSGIGPTKIEPWSRRRLDHYSMEGYLRGECAKVWDSGLSCFKVHELAPGVSKQDKKNEETAEATELKKGLLNTEPILNHRFTSQI
ncbi:hypothetical protein C8J57DRAFT_1245540 [Mycena rebaudengoi]|nr:hypothetical protein C8J57DRAFT_1245540 [Mycena rebaudengoi]